MVLKASLDDRRSFVVSSIASSAAAALSVGSSNPAIAADVGITPVSAVELDPTKTKVALWGFGKQNKLNAKYLYERKIPVVSVISRHDIGQDYGMVNLES